jgi:hypothetical protein
MKKPKKSPHAKQPKKPVTKIQAKSKSKRAKPKVNTRKGSTTRKKQKKSLAKGKGVFRVAKSGRKSTKKTKRPVRKAGKRASKKVLPSLKGVMKGGKSIFLDLSPYKTFKRKLKEVENWKGLEITKRVNKFEMFPRGVIVVITSKKPRGMGDKDFSNAHVSPPEFVPNKRNVKAYVLGLLTKKDDDFMEWADLMNDMTGEDLGDARDLVKEFKSGWTYSSDRITTIEIKFMYAPPQV